MPRYDVTMELDGVDLLDTAFLDRLGTDDGLAECATLVRGERQLGVVELTADSEDAAVATVTSKLRALDPGMRVVLRRVDQRWV